MRVRIIAGLFGKRFLQVPNSRRTHPMSERTRGAIFNKIQHELPDARVLDAFAGTGALGLESLSRGARQVLLVEKDRLAQRVLKENIETLHCEEAAILVRSPVSAWMKSSAGVIGDFDIIFADPPYWDPQLPTIERLAEHLKEDGLFIFSHPDGIEAPESLGHATLQEVRSYAGANIAFYR